MKKDFKSHVQSLSAKEIILAMVRGLENPKVKVDMGTFGYDDDNGVCYGCAATNTICEISGHTFKPGEIFFTSDRATAVNTNLSFLDNFERAINALRQGDVDEYNSIAERYGFSLIEDTIGISMPSICVLDTNYTQQQLDIYRLLAFSQPE